MTERWKTKKSFTIRAKAAAALNGDCGAMTVKRSQLRMYELLVRQEELLEWIQAVLEDPNLASGSGQGEFAAGLQSGVALCKLLNTIAPKSVPKYHRRPGK